MLKPDRGQAHHALAPILSCQKANQPPRRRFKPFEDVLFHMQLALLRPKRKFMLSVRIQMGVVRNDKALQGETLHHNEPRHPHGARGCAVVHGHGAAAGDAALLPHGKERGLENGPTGVVEIRVDTLGGRGREGLRRGRLSSR